MICTNLPWCKIALVSHAGSWVCKGGASCTNLACPQCAKGVRLPLIANEAAVQNESRRHESAVQPQSWGGGFARISPVVGLQNECASPRCATTAGVPNTAAHGRAWVLQPGTSNLGGGQRGMHRDLDMGVPPLCPLLPVCPITHPPL